MATELYRELYHTEIVDIVAKTILRQCGVPVEEYKLTNGKIADIYWQRGSDKIIIECKTILTPFIIQTTYDKYHGCCNLLSIAAPEHEIRRIITPQPAMGWPRLPPDIGFITVSHAGAESVREPKWRPLPAGHADS